MATDPNLWHTLRAGDYIRFVEYPLEFLQPGYFVHPETEEVYKRLLKRKSPLRVYEIDEYGSPWIRFRFVRQNEKCEWHFLSVNHSGFVKIIPRAKR